MAYYQSLARRAWSKTYLVSWDKSLAAVYAILRAVADRRNLDWHAILNLLPGVIVSAVGAYLVLCLAQFAWQYFRAIGADQEAKRIAITDLNAFLRPPLSPKSSHLLGRLQKRIDVAELVFNKFSQDDYSDWNMNTQVLLRSWLGRSSPWLHRFSEAAKLSGVEGIIRPEGALLEQVAVLYQLVDEVQRGRVFTLDSVFKDEPT